MDTFPVVSETALIALKARAIEAEKENPVLIDEISPELVTKIRPILPVEIQKRLLDRRYPSSLTRHIALRTRKYDTYTKLFLEKNPDGMVVNLGCGFDTRYWRVSEKKWKYIELDLPEVVEAKKKALVNILKYKMIGCSVSDEKWIEEILSMQKKNILFLAEGLFMYLPKKSVVHIFNKLSESFSQSLIVFEVVNEKYTRGIWKRLVQSKIKRSLGTKAGSSYEFGLRNAKDVESYGKNIKVVEEWSYFEDEEILPHFLRLFRDVKFFTRTQWTIKATIG